MITKSGMKKLIADVEYLLDNGVDAEGNPLTNETEMLLRQELIYLNSKFYKLFG
tara:strand:- start:112 stop:273 length:162 start_codon:yes stop_codon:yes gene_type:complete